MKHVCLVKLGGFLITDKINFKAFNFMYVVHSQLVALNAFLKNSMESYGKMRDEILWARSRNEAISAIFLGPNVLIKNERFNKHPQSFLETLVT